ncbi:MAG: hypothetical protein GXY08_04765 [Ruminococcus sp.]|nr:hypothetical protein [Ruminococcus sp.]
MTLSVKEGYMASNSGVTFWKWWKLQTHFDYDSIYSANADIKIGQQNKMGEISFILRLILETDRGRFIFCDETLIIYSSKLRKDTESQQAILENSDIMRLKLYIEERISRKIY